MSLLVHVLRLAAINMDKVTAPSSPRLQALGSQQAYLLPMFSEQEAFHPSQLARDERYVIRVNKHEP
jgi:hypothetical protein